MDHDGAAPEVKSVRVTRNGKPYHSKVLGSTVQSQTVATVFHDGQAGDEASFSFTIGKYKVRRGEILFDEPIEETPKSKVTLTNSEFKKLLDLLNESVPILSSNDKHYITFSEEIDPAQFDQVAQILSQASTAQKINLIFEHGLGSDDLISAVRHRDRKQQLVYFDELLKQNAVEALWQKWFEKNSWVLGSDFVEVLEERRIDSGHIADYLVRAADSHLDLIEIKRPGMNFWNATKDHENWIPHPDLVAALTQCNNYLFELEREMNSIKTVGRIKAPIARPRAILIGGRSSKWDQSHFEAQRLLNSSLQNTQILTYDQVRGKAERLLGTANDHSAPTG